ncbi:hypothetical protein [Pedobacter xixiisoli]|uniref:T9SS C-terminal target domain-containing protein n=1 Tax=Pedobacter xixiisoli TaxID=1476464 RepID=A0A286A054_9SPHI|nr:hypothetical protein [Pedobacter xixiisoli]SOD15283.1 hypothetical protein SAMN06297358_2270 [Pedobacter xixiisoli]
MNKLKFSKFLLVTALASVSVFTACKKDKGADEETVLRGDLANGTVITGELVNDVTLLKGNSYVLKGGVHVKTGKTITIQEGVTVKSDANEPATAYLLIEPGAKIMAQGTAASPIIFTSGATAPKEQDWGGIIVCGLAPVNGEGGRIASEMGAGVTYGGTNAADNSGVLRYIRVEYTGKKQTADKEHNGFTFEGVGNGTTVEYLSVYRGGDDAFEWFGGTVNVKYLFAYGAQDDTFDWTFGWNGKAQFLVGVQADGVADRGIEADNSNKNRTASPYSNPTISNVTLVGSLTAKTGDDPTNATDVGKTTGLKLREGTRGKLHNFVVYNFNNGVDVEHDETLNNVADATLIIKNSDISNVNPWALKHTLPSTTGATRPPFTGVNPFISATYANTTTASSTRPSYMTSVFVGTTATDAINPTTLDAFFTAANYKGAVQTGSDWTNAAWVRTDKRTFPN